jgi:hypothetical protein
MIDLHGSAHVLMQADLAHYPPMADGITGLRAGKARGMSGSRPLPRWSARAGAWPTRPTSPR